MGLEGKLSLLSSVKKMIRGESASCEVVKPSARASRLHRLLSEPLSLSPEIGDAIDRITAEMMKRSDPHPSERYETVAEHFAGASSTRRKLAVWEALVREQRPRSILELGTAYGLSAVTMAMAQERPRIVTIDFFEPQASIGPENIRTIVPEGVRCITKDKNLALPELAAAGERFDYVFHDGGHTGDYYVKDFHTIMPMVEPASTYIIDDIAWDKTPEIRKYTSESRRTCYEGWLEVVDDERVEGAMVWKSVGILLLR
jgi:predicted O-methyltransferase YrrM